MYEKTFPNKRFKHTLKFLKKHIDTSQSILDLGVKNLFSDIMISEGYNVTNTAGEDLDDDHKSILNSESDVVTAFEIIEHLLSPYEVLKSIKSKKILISVPLRLWFSSAYRSKTDERDWHYHEFEDWQLDWLMQIHRFYDHAFLYNVCLDTMFCCLNSQRTDNRLRHT